MKNNSNFINIELGQTKMIAILFSSLIFYIVAIILWKQSTIDNAIVRHFNFVYENELYLKLVKALSRYGMSFITALYALLIFLSFRFEKLKHERPVAVQNSIHASLIPNFVI